MAPVIGGFFRDINRIPGTECQATVTGNTVSRVDPDFIPVLPEHIIGTVVDAPAAEHAPVGID
jgi:hypothetical protein